MPEDHEHNAIRREDAGSLCRQLMCSWKCYSSSAPTGNRASHYSISPTSSTHLLRHIGKNTPVFSLLSVRLQYFFCQYLSVSICLCLSVSQSPFLCHKCDYCCNDAAKMSVYLLYFLSLGVIHERGSRTNALDITTWSTDF